MRTHAHRALTRLNATLRHIAADPIGWTACFGMVVLVAWLVMGISS